MTVTSEPGVHIQTFTNCVKREHILALHFFQNVFAVANLFYVSIFSRILGWHACLHGTSVNWLFSCNSSGSISKISADMTKVFASSRSFTTTNFN